MKVELREHWGRNLATGEQEQLSQYRVFVDGRSVGFIGWKEGSKLLLTTRFGPRERKEIEREVTRLMESTIEVTSKQAPDVPPEMLEVSDEGVSIDDID